jgi:hypothetical protein
MNDNDNDNEMLIAACELGLMDVAEKLLARGADVNAKGKKGWTPLQWAVSEGHCVFRPKAATQYDPNRPPVMMNPATPRRA